MTIENLATDSLLAGQEYKVYVRVENADAKTVFEDEKPVRCSMKSVSIFVQTDKAIYKPSSTGIYTYLTQKGIFCFEDGSDVRN